MNMYENFAKSTLKELIVKLHSDRVDKASIKKYIDITLVDEVFKDIEDKEKQEAKQKQSWNRLSFTLTDDHVKLLRRASIDWREDGYIGHWEMDDKRPYGNSDIEEDIMSITGKDLSVLQAQKLHEETKFALQVMLLNGTIKTGEYKRKDHYGDDWKPVDKTSKEESSK